MTELRELKVQLNEVTAMKSEIEDLKKQMNQKGDYTKSKFNRKRFGCPTCRKNNVTKRCLHCYLCGGSDHFRAECNSTGN